MVSRTFKKVAIIIAIVVVLGIALVPIFARGHGRMGYGHNNGYNNGGCYNGDGCGSRGGNNNYGGRGHNYNDNNSNSSSRHGMGNYQVGGTIQFIDEDASTISVANADGALTVVHMNPTTSIIDATDLDTMHNDYDNSFGGIDTEGMTDAEIRLEYFNAREAAIEEWETEMADRTLSFDNLEVGDWVEVSTASTGTVTREANAVRVYR